MDAILSLPIIDGPLPWIVYGLAVAILVFLLIRRPTPRRLLALLVGVLAGVLVAVTIFVVANETRALDPDPLPAFVLWWAIATFVAIGIAVVNLWHSPWWRKVIAVLGIVVFAIAGTIGVNAAYGINPTVGSLFGIVGGDPISIPTPGPSASEAPEGPLYET